MWINEIRGDLPYLRDLIVVEGGQGSQIPFRQKYKRAPSLCKSAATSPDDDGNAVEYAVEGGYLRLTIASLPALSLIEVRLP